MNASLSVHTYAHAFEPQVVAAAAPSPVYGGVGGQTTRDKAFCTRMTTEHPFRMLADSNDSHGILNCAHLVCIVAGAVHVLLPCECTFGGTKT